MIILPPIAEMPPPAQQRVICSIAAAKKYEIPANILLAVADEEHGKPGQWVKNTNGSHDVGYMQFNTTYLKELAPYGITANDLAQANCYSFKLAAWRLRQHILHDQGDIWTRVANYHSRTPKYNTPYRADLLVRAARWQVWLQRNHPAIQTFTTKPTVKMITITPAIAYHPRTITFNQNK